MTYLKKDAELESNDILTYELEYGQVENKSKI